MTVTVSHRQTSPGGVPSQRMKEHFRLIYRNHEEHQRSIVTETHDDTYRLSAPLCRGRATVTSNGRVLHDGEVKPGFLRLQSPGERVEILTQSRMRAAVIMISGEKMREIIDECDYRRDGEISRFDALTQPNYQVERLSLTLLSVPEIDAQYRSMFIDGLARAMLAILLGDQRRTARTRRPGQGKGLSDADFERCVEFADAMIGERLDLDAWAGSVGMSASEFARRFQERTKQAPYGWFMHRRIDLAKQLLRNPSLAVADIATHVGFCSQSHFTVAFRQRVGDSPARWRHQVSA